MSLPTLRAKPTVLVVGAGMVGTCTALQLALRGAHVQLLDARGPGEETSYGNAGIIQREAVEPYAFPRSLRTMLRVALGRGADIAFQWAALPALIRPLLAYWGASSPRVYPGAVDRHARMIVHCLREHEALFRIAGVALEKRSGYLALYRHTRSFDLATAMAQRLRSTWSLQSAVLDLDRLKRVEPALAHSKAIAGAVHWNDPWPTSDPGALVKAYAAAFEAQGGALIRARCTGIVSMGAGWQLQTTDAVFNAEHVVIAAGPWALDLVRPLGYRLPLFVKRGYHQHYPQSARVNHPLLDGDTGFVLAPMAQGLRMTTGAEFAERDAPASDRQLRRCELAARDLLELGEACEVPPWLGSRPCTPDMLPVMGAAPRHRGLWFNFGHAHQGFTLGPVAGRLVAELIFGESPLIDPRPYRPERFMG